MSGSKLQTHATGRRGGARSTHREKDCGARIWELTLTPRVMRSNPEFRTGEDLNGRLVDEWDGMGSAGEDVPSCTEVPDSAMLMKHKNVEAATDV
ncbi:hypothetical protein ILYODFUR_007113 [Ilyodon furcidens]|uniref:Uncharacterized protein n=1 Tax=Ilyodon furcidens TaxID=33524 RepID=A0ABV0U547_9TELE